MKGVQLSVMVKSEYVHGRHTGGAIYAGEKINFKNTLRNDSYYNSNFPVRINKEQQED